MSMFNVYKTSADQIECQLPTLLDKNIVLYGFFYNGLNILYFQISTMP